MRTTLDIDDDLLAAAKEIARRQGCSAGRAVSELLRQALTRESASPAPSSRHRAAVGGFRPFASRGAPVTDAAVHLLRDAEGV